MTSNLSRSRKQFWEEHITQWNATELSQVEYCRRNKISLKSFQYWERKTGRSSAPALVELPLFKSAPVCASPSYPQLCLVVDQHYRIKIGKGFDCEDLSVSYVYWGGYDIFAVPHARLSRTGKHGYAQGDKQPVDSGGRHPASGSVLRPSLCILQSREKDTKDIVLGSQRFLSLAKKA